MTHSWIYTKQAEKIALLSPTWRKACGKERFIRRIDWSPILCMAALPAERGFEAEREHRLLKSAAWDLSPLKLKCFCRAQTLFVFNKFKIVCFHNVVTIAVTWAGSVKCLSVCLGSFWISRFILKFYLHLNSYVLSNLLLQVCVIPPLMCLTCLMSTPSLCI